MRKVRNMNTKRKNRILIAAALLTAFTIFTFLLGFVDVAPIGPCGSSVGFATLNSFAHKLTGVNATLYTVTDWLGLVPIFIALGFAILGLCQWIGRKGIKRVDHSILWLGGFYAIVAALYLFFESVVINYRPVLIAGRMEASYPSSTTLLVASVIPTAIMQCNARIRNRVCRRIVLIVLSAFLAFMVIGRLVSGVHWFTDIMGGLLLSAGLVTAYRAASPEIL